jgi:hypothetical protein
MYSVRDLASFLGLESSANIHNIVVGGCNLEGEINAREWRRHFKNATNIVHVPQGEPGYQPMFWQVFFLPSDRFAPVYERAQRTEDGSIDYHLENRPSTDSIRMEPYVAELFKPGSSKPYRTQLAGRELLRPSSSSGNFFANRPVRDLP